MNLNITFLVTIFLMPSDASKNRFPPVLSFISSTLESSLNGTMCAKDMKHFINDLFKLEDWALEMFDSSSKLQSGFLRGKLNAFGDFDECIFIRKRLNGSNILGKYCTVLVIPSEKMVETMYEKLTKMGKVSSGSSLKLFRFFAKLSYGLCIPKSCTAENLKVLFTNILNKFRIPLRLNFEEEACYYYNKPIEADLIDYIIFFSYFIIIVGVLSNTLWDAYLRKNGTRPNMFISSFSLYHNSEKLFCTKSKTSLSCINGIKTISMVWIIFAHIIVGKMAPQINSSYHAIIDWVKYPETCIILASHYAVDTSFAISGLLMIYMVLSKSKDETKMLYLYIHRFIRLTPALLAVLCFNISVAKYFAYGPNTSSFIDIVQDKCRKLWWQVILFVNNFGNFMSGCLPHTWYLASDTQLQILFPVLQYFLRKNPIIFFKFVCGICLLSFTYTCIKVWQTNVGFIPFWEVTQENSHLIYISTISRAPAWLIGTCWGYLLYKQRLTKFTISKNLNIFLWTLSLCTIVSLVLSQKVDSSNTININWSIFMNAFSRPLWSLAVCYIIFSCSIGQGGLVNNFLSHSLFHVMGKLTYSMYVTHVTIIQAVLFNSKVSSYVSNFQNFYDFCGIFVIILAASIFVFLFFESPFIGLGNCLHQKVVKKIQ